MNIRVLQIDAALGSELNPFTYETAANGSYGNKFCRCSECKKVELSVPGADYVICADRKLRCPTCFNAFLMGNGMQPAVGADDAKDAN